MVRPYLDLNGLSTYVRFAWGQNRPGGLETMRRRRHSVSQSVCPTACKRTCLPCLHLIAGCCLCLFWKEGLWLPNRWANKEVSAQPPLNQPQCFFGEFFSRTRAPSWQHQQQLKPSRLTEDWLTWASCRIQLLTNVPMIMIIVLILVIWRVFYWSMITAGWFWSFFRILKRCWFSFDCKLNFGLVNTAFSNIVLEDTKTNVNCSSNS